MATPDETKTGFIHSRVDDDDDVEGHGGPGMQRRAIEDDDVEGHSSHMHPRASDDEDDDVEGHIGQFRSPSSRGE